jgi:hypothetical protein
VFFFLLAFICIVSMSSHPGAGWASDTTLWLEHTVGPSKSEAQVGTTASLSSQRW